MRRALVCVAAAFALACAAGSPQPVEPARDLVLARVGVPLRPAQAQPAQRAEPRRLGTEWRNALPATREGFEVEVPAEATRLAFAHAVAGGGPARFEVAWRADAGAGARWQPLFETQAGQAAWRDEELALPPAGAVRRLRFTAQAEGCEPLWGSILLLGPRAAAPGVPPDVLLVSLDTLGADYLGAFSGRTDVSPQLDAFLAGNASFRRAYAQYGNTLVSHASLFSALYPRHHGVADGSWRRLSSSLVEALAAAGYRTVAFTEGGFVSAAFGFSRGFDAYDDGNLELAGLAAGASETFAHVARWLDAHPRERVFVFAHSYEVHTPYLPRDEAALAVAARTTPDDDRVFSRDEQTRQQFGYLRRSLPQRDLDRLRALYLGEIYTVDRAVGQLLASLSEQGRDERTLVVITADHGEQFGEWDRLGHGQSLHSRVLHVPLALRWPGVIQPVAVDAPVMLVDVMPTVLELLGIERPPALDGRSLVPFLTGEQVSPRPAFSEQANDLRECVTPGGEAWCRDVDRVAVHDSHFELVSSARPGWTRLYDLGSDAGEERDVVAQHPDEVRRLLALANEYRGSARPPAPDSAPAVDADTIERLRSLGYLPDPAPVP